MLGRRADPPVSTVVALGLGHEGVLLGLAGAHRRPGTSHGHRIDDDLSVREALGGLLRSVGLQAQLHGSVPEFLKAGRLDGPTCLVLDVRLPDQSGLDFQRELTTANIWVPIVFITGYGDIPMSVQAMKSGAIEFLTKPFRGQDLLDAVQQGLTRDQAWLENEKATAILRARFETLTLREREVMALVATGRLNKQIACDIGITEIAVKASRSQVMRKMNAASLPDLVGMANKLNLKEENPRSVTPAYEFGRPHSVYSATDLPRPIPVQFSRRSAAVSSNPKLTLTDFTLKRQRLIRGCNGTARTTRLRSIHRSTGKARG